MQGSGEQLLVLNKHIGSLCGQTYAVIYDPKSKSHCRLGINSNFMRSVPDSDFHRDLEQKESSKAWCEKGGNPVYN